jgi:hypothetical protein
MVPGAGFSTIFYVGGTPLMAMFSCQITIVKRAGTPAPHFLPLEHHGSWSRFLEDLLPWLNPANGDVSRAKAPL